MNVKRHDAHPFRWLYGCNKCCAIWEWSHFTEFMCVTTARTTLLLSGLHFSVHTHTKSVVKFQRAKTDIHSPLIYLVTWNTHKENNITATVKSIKAEALTNLLTHPRHNQIQLEEIAVVVHNAKRVFRNITIYHQKMWRIFDKVHRNEAVTVKIYFKGTSAGTFSKSSADFWTHLFLSLSRSLTN